MSFTSEWEQSRGMGTPTAALKPTAPVQKKGGWLSNFISEAGGTAGGLGGAALGAGIGSIVPGIGTVIGGLIGGGLGAFGGGTLGSATEQQVQDEKVDWGKALGEGTVEGIMGAGPLRIGKLVMAGGKIAKAGATGGKMFAQGAAEDALSKRIGGGLLAKVTGKTAPLVDDAAGKMMNVQTGLTRKEMRRIGVDAPELYSKMNKDYGIYKLDDIARIADNVTGANGVHSEGVRNVLFSGKGIDTSDISKTLDDLFTTKGPNISDATRKNVQTQLRRANESMYADQPLNPLGNPGAAFDSAQSFRAMARDLKTLPTPKSSDKQLAAVYNGLAHSIEKKLYTQPGLEEILPKVRKNMVSQYKKLSAGATGSDAKAYAKLASEAEQMRSVKDMRSAQQKWVLASKVDEKSAEAAGNAALKMAGGGGIVSRVGNAAMDAVTPKIGAVLQNGAAEVGKIPTTKAINRGGNFMGTNMDAGVKNQGGLLGQVARSGTASVVNGGLVTPEPTAPTDAAYTPDGLSSDATGTADGNPMAAGTSISEPDTDKVNVALQQAAMKALAAGDKQGLDNIMKVAQLFQSMQPTVAKPTKKTEAQVAREEAYGISQDALGALDAGGVATGPLAGAIEDFKGIFNAGDANSIDFNRKIGALRSAIVKARGGSAVTPTELKLIDEFVPKKGDSEQMIRSKLQYIQSTFGRATGEIDPTTVDELNAGA